MIRGIAFILALIIALAVYRDDRRFGWQHPGWAIAVFAGTWPWLIGAFDLARGLWHYFAIGIGLR